MAGLEDDEKVVKEDYSGPSTSRPETAEGTHSPNTLAPSLESPGISKSVIIVLTVTCAMVVNIANSTSTAIALPTIGRELHLEEAQLQWLVSAYALSSGCLLLMFGRIADVYGRKKVFLAGSFFQAAFTLACGFPNNILALDILRGLQGVGAAATIPASLGILAHAFPPSQARSLAFATFSAGAPIGAVFGSVVGGVLTEFTAKTWRSSFYLMSAITSLFAIAGWFSIDNDLPSIEVDKRVDWLGAFLVSAGLVLIVFVLSQGEVAPKKWATAYIIALLIAGVLLVVLFVLWQYYLEKVQDDPNAPYSAFTPPPLMKISIWKRANGRFAAMMVIAFVNWCSFLAWTFWIQLFYQNYMQYTAMQTVVRLLPMFVSGVLCNVFVGLTATRVPVIYMIVLGTGATSCACLLFALIVPSAPYWAFGFPATIISVMGADLVFSIGTIYVAKVSLPHEQSVAGAMFNTMTQLGTAVGVTVSTVVYNQVSAKHAPGSDRLPSYKAAQWTCFAFGILGALLSLFFFRGIGVVGDRKPKESLGQVDSNELGSTRDTESDVERTALDEKL